MVQQFDVVVIGAGPAGYVAAIRAAQLGRSVACVEEWISASGEPALGGTCLNVGCIPSKALLESSENYERVTRRFGEHGISVTGASFDLAKMMARKDAIVAKMTQGIEFLFRKNRIAWLKGRGSFAGRSERGWQIQVSGRAGAETVEAAHVVIATGSRARALPGVAIDNQRICDNVGALSFREVPQRLGVIGAGVIGLELGSVWRRLGAQVTILEALPEFLGIADESVSSEAWKLFSQDPRLEIRLAAQIAEVAAGEQGVSVAYAQGGAQHTLECDRLVVAVGRVPNTEGLGAQTVGLKIDERGRIEVDEHCRTGLPNVYAVGDVVRGPMLAHKGMEEGVMVAELIAGHKAHVNLETIPWVIYTAPEIAWVGKTERQLRAEGTPYRAGSFPFVHNGRAKGQDQTEGFVKMLAHAKTDEILGVHVIHAQASELIAEAVVAMEFRACSEDIARIVHAHPSLSEVMHEAALAVDKRTLHL